MHAQIDAWQADSLPYTSERSGDAPVALSLQALWNTLESAQWSPRASGSADHDLGAGLAWARRAVAVSLIRGAPSNQGNVR